MAQSETAFFDDLLALAGAGDVAAAVRAIEERSAWLLERAPAARGDEPYGRLPLHRDPRGELMLAGWRAQQRCAPHDHGDAHGFVVVLAGAFTETQYAKRAFGLSPVAETAVARGSAVRVCADLIHDMRCDAAGATLHVYLPAIDRMRVYDLMRRTTFVVDDNAGAWLPCDARHVLAIEAWRGAPE